MTLLHHEGILTPEVKPSFKEKKIPSEHSGRILLIFVKYPEPGRVKTRLAEVLGNEKAAEVYAAMAQGIVRNVSNSSEYETIVFFDPPDREIEIENWLGKEHRLFTQEGQSLGERMTNAFEKSFSLDALKTLIIGTDCVEITPEIISGAFASLDETDVVIGPAKDGGYYLLGTKTMIPEIFDGIEWSTSLVLDQTLSRIKKKGLTFQLLETLKDIDSAADLDEDVLNKLLGI